MSASHSLKLHYYKYFTALLLFGSNGIVASMISLPSYQIVLLRTMIGSLLLFTIFCLRRERFSFLQKKKQFLFLTISGIAMGASWMFLYEAYQQIGVSLASLSYYCGPVIVMALSPFLFRERFVPAKIAGFCIVFLGILLVNGQDFSAGNNRFGLFCGAMSAVMYAFMVIFNKKASAISGLENSLLQLAISFLTAAVFVGFRYGYAITLLPSDYLPLLMLGLVNTGIGCYFYFSSIGQLPVQTVAVCGYIEPLSAVLFSVLFLKEVLSLPQMIGALCIIGGAVLNEKKGCI